LGDTRINAIAKQMMPTISVMALTCKKKDNNAFTVLLIYPEFGKGARR
jgi:hypothetical protein